MADKLDFSKLDKDESLLLWEQLFPEYAKGGEAFPSGQERLLPQTNAAEEDGLIQSSEKELPVQIEEDDFETVPLPLEVMEKLRGKKAGQAITPSFEEEDYISSDPNMAWLQSAIDEENEAASKGQDYWADRFNQQNFPGMDLMAVSYLGIFSKNPLENHLILRRVVRDFTRLLGYNYVNDLRAAGVSEEGIFYMRKGKLPENYTIHLKYPLEYGGSIDFSNMVFMQDKPYHDMIHEFINEQILAPHGVSYPPLLYVPVPVGKIYVPFGVFTGSGGKNKQDRSVYAGFSKAAFDKIALRAMPGR